MMLPDVIASRKNEGVRRAAKLAGSAAFRREQGEFLAEGARLCADAAVSGAAIETAFFTEEDARRYQGYLERILPRARSVCRIAPHVADLLSATKRPQGIFCVIRMPEHRKTPREMEPAGCYVALENIQDPANLGAVLRTAEALGISGAFLSEDCCDLYGPKVLRASMGAVFRLPFCVLPDFAEGMRSLKKSGFFPVAAVPDKNARSVTETKFPEGSVAAVGNEGNGLSAAAVEACAGRVTIPMPGRAESLNAAASAAILMWEMMRTRGK